MSDEITPITREETYLNAISEGGESGLSPITREEIYLSAIAGESDLPADMTPITRREIYLQKIYDNGGAGGGGEAEGTVEINITQNGTITRNVAHYASAEITTNVPNSYEASDEGKVVSNGALASQTSRNVTENGTYDTTVNDEVVVNVPNPSTGTKQITSNGTHDVTDYASAQVNVPNSYSASDEGKVVSNGALVGQTSRTVTSNGTVDTTLNDEVVVNVPTGITPSGSQTFTENGTYNVSSLAEAVVDVQASGGGSVDDVASGAFPSGDITINVIPITSALNSRSNIGNVIFNASKLSSSCFQDSSITKFFCLKNIKPYTQNSAFNRCASLKTVVMPKTEWLDNNIFFNCTALEVADVGATAINRGGVFQNCNSLSTLILRSSTVCNLGNTSNLNNSPFTGFNGGVGTLYVPSSLVESYKTATNWSTLYTNGTMQVLPIEGSIYENAYGDGTPISA